MYLSSIVNFDPRILTVTHNPNNSTITMKSVIFASVLASAAAFAPAAKQASSSALKSYENEVGVIAPTGFFGES